MCIVLTVLVRPALPGNSYIGGSPRDAALVLCGGLQNLLAAHLYSFYLAWTFYSGLFDLFPWAFL